MWNPFASSGRPPADTAPPPEQEELSLGPLALTHLEQVAAASFQRQVDLDEAVWSTLPFFAALFGVAFAILAKLVDYLPAIGWTVYSVATHALVALSAGMFGLSLWFVWLAGMSRDYRYPPPIGRTRHYAEEIAVYHHALGKTGEALDAAVQLEMRGFMIDEFAASERENFVLNRGRFKARAQAFVYDMIGLGLAFSATILIFSHDVLYPSASRAGADGHVEVRRHAPAAGAASAALGAGGGRAAQPEAHPVAGQEKRR